MHEMTTRRGMFTAMFGVTHALLRMVAAVAMIGAIAATVAGATPAGAQPLTARIEIRVHSCPDDLDATGFSQHLQRCTSERALYGVALGVQTGLLGATAFQYSRPDNTGRADLMVWPEVGAGTVTIDEVAPEPIRPSVAFCSLQPDGAVPLTLDGAEVPLADGTMTIDLDGGDTLMCDWYRFPGGVTAEDSEDGTDDADSSDGSDGSDGDGTDDDDGTDGTDDGDGGDGNGNGIPGSGGVTLDPDTGDASEEPTGAQIFVRTWECGDAVPERPETLDFDTADGLVELTDACSRSEGSTPFSLGDVIEEDGDGDGNDEEIADDGVDFADDGGDDGNGNEEEGQFEGIVAGDGTIVDEEGGPDEAVAGGPSDDGGAGDGADPGIVAEDEDDEEAAGDDGAGFGVYPPIQAGGDTYRGWNGLAGGVYTIQQTTPPGNDEPLVICDGIFEDAQPGDNVNELTAIDGAVIYGLSETEQLRCDWFNRSARADGDGDGGDDGGDGGDGADVGVDPGIAADGDLDPDADDDGDFLTNGEEIDDYRSDPLNADTDGDGLDDYLEVITYDTDPTNADSDGDGENDGTEVDNDGDPLDPNA